MYSPGTRSEGAKEDGCFDKRKQTNKQTNKASKARIRNFNLVPESLLRISVRKKVQLLND